MKIWAIYPSANPERARESIKRWQRAGYYVAILFDNLKVGKAIKDIVDASIFEETYRGYFASNNTLARLALSKDADIIVISGDDMSPDEDHEAEEIGREYLQVYPAGLGVMQPTGDVGLKCDTICGSPWVGRAWVRRAYGGRGIFWPGYKHFYGDEELKDFSKSLGLLWQRSDITQYHDHPARTDRKKNPQHTDYQKNNSKTYWHDDKILFRQRKAQGWPDSEILSD